MAVLVRSPQMQAIKTRYLGPTDTRGARVSAECEAKRIIVPWDHALDAPDNHAAAAQEICARMDWRGEMIGGGLRSGGYAFVFMPRALLGPGRQG